MTGRPHRVRYNTTSLARALTILDLFEPGTPTLSATQIARGLRVRPGSLYPALGTLERFGYLVRRPDKRFRLGLKLLAGTADSQDDHLVAEGAGDRGPH